jgi:hypothetical protein
MSYAMRDESWIDTNNYRNPGLGFSNLHGRFTGNSCKLQSACSMRVKPNLDFSGGTCCAYRFDKGRMLWLNLRSGQR